MKNICNTFSKNLFLKYIINIFIMKHITKYNVLRSYSRLLGNFYLQNTNRNIHKLNSDVKSSTNANGLKVSTLYVPTRHAGEMYQILKPLIDVNYIEKNLESIDHSCCVRGIDLDLGCTINFLKEWIAKKDKLEKHIEKVKELQEDVKRLKLLDLQDECEPVNKDLLVHIDKLKLIKEDLYDTEDIVMPLVQKIPNIVDSAVFNETNSTKIHIKPNSDCSHAFSHMDIATGLSLLEFSDISPTAYFLKGPLAELEISAQIYFSEKLQEASFAPMSCADFCKSFILESTGLDPYSYDECIPLANNRSSKIGQNYNLIGGASFESFCAYFANMNTEYGTIPAKYFAIGRHYEASNRNSSLSPSLFSVVQSSRIHAVVLTNQTDESLQFEALLETLLSCYLSLKIPFRTVDVTAQQLNLSESCRINIELWSPAQREFVTVAHVSQRNDFVSKRLHITYGTKYAVNGFCSIVEGVAVNIPVLLGCIVENYAKSDKSIELGQITNLFNVLK